MERRCCSRSFGHVLAMKMNMGTAYRISPITASARFGMKPKLGRRSVSTAVDLGVADTYRPCVSGSVTVTAMMLSGDRLIERWNVDVLLQR